VLDAHPRHGGFHGGVLGLARELRRVDPDDDELAGEAPLEPAQLLHDVLAVHARLREEVEEDDLPAQRGEREGVDADPASGAVELRRAYADTWHEGPHCAGTLPRHP
jgi:hypothetical protein